MSIKLSKNLCCSVDLTVASRLIAFIGITISVLLVTVFISDKFMMNEEDTYEISRKTALALGLDWKHFHENASASFEHDPEGKMISTIVIFYSIAFLVINLLLFFGSIRGDWCYALPWLVCEFCGCVSKFGALIYHLNCDPYNLSNVFIGGSVIYIVVMVWWWLVVYFAQSAWKYKKKCNFDLEMSSLGSESPRKVENVDENIRGKFHSYNDTVAVESPGPYHPNTNYALI